MTSTFAGGIAKLGAGVAAIGAPIGLIAGMAKVVSVGAEFQKQMSNVNAAVTTTGDQFKQMSDLAESLGAATAFTAGNAAEAMTELGKAGFSASQILAATPGVLTLAAAGEVEMAEAATIAAATLNQFNLPATEMATVVDQLAKAAQSGSVGMSTMGTQLAYAAAAGTKAGMSLAETSGAVASLATALTAEKAGTGFRAMMNSITSPTAIAAEEMKRLGIETLDANKEFLPFADIIANFSGALDGMSAGARSASLGKMFTTNGDPAISAMMRLNADGIRAVTASIEDSNGFGLETANKKLDNVAGSFEMLKSAASGMAINTFQLIQGPLQAAITWLANAIATDIPMAFAYAKTVVSFALNNMSTIMTIAGKTGVMSLIMIGDTLAWLGGTAFPYLLEWISTNWMDIFITVAEGTVTIFKNLSTNIMNIFAGVYEYIANLGQEPLAFDLVPMTDGLVNTIQELEIPPLVASQAVGELSAEIADMEMQLGGDFGQVWAAEMASIAPVAAMGEALSPLSDELPGDLPDATKTRETETTERSPIGIALAGSKEMFESINAAVRGGKDADLKSIAKQSTKQTALAEKQTGLLETIAENSDSDDEEFNI
jgi:TP901 family phage tail tape measure protein